MMQRSMAVLILVGVFVHPSGDALAITWTNPMGGNFDTPGNWNSGTVAGTNDVAEFDLLGPYTVDFTATHNTAQLDVLGATVIFDLMGNTYTVNGPATIDDSVASLGALGSRSLEVLNGTLAVGKISDPFRIGGLVLGNAELIVGSGGTVRSLGQLEIGGNDNVNTNSVSVLDGGILSTEQIVLIGGTLGQKAASGTLTVTGSGSEFTLLSNLLVGGAGTGVLNIENGAVVSTDPLNVTIPTAAGIIAEHSGGRGTVNVSTGATWNDPLGIDVGRGGSGFLNISGGGVVSSPTSRIARLPGSSGSVNIDGANATWVVTGDLTIGGTTTAAGGVGTVAVTNSGRLESTGTIRVSSGSQLGGDATIEAVNVNVDAGGRLSGTPTIQGNVFNFGIVAPGFSPGTMTVSGNFEQGPEGLLEIEVEGLVPGIEHDELLIDGNATLAGRLDVPVTGAPGFPLVNDQITFLRTVGSAGVMGQFHSLSSPNLATAAPGLALRVVYSATDVKLRFVTPEVNTFIPPPTGIGNWSDGRLWTGDVPDSANLIELVNESPTAQRVDVEFFGPQNSANAFAHELHVSGATESMTVRVGSAATLSVINGTVVDNNGVVHLDGGTLLTHCLEVEAGGTLSGSGQVVGDVSIGVASGTNLAVLNPGSSPGTLEIDGNLQLGSNSISMFEVDDTVVAGVDFDLVDVTGTVALGGLLSIDGSEYGGPMPTSGPGDVPTVDLVTAGNITPGSIFEAVETTGTDDLFFAPIYAPAAFSVGLYQEGDMDRDGELEDDDDPAAFALAITDPSGYFDTYFIDGPESGDLDNDNDLDFDDIDGFLDLFESVTAAQLFELIHEAATNRTISPAASTHEVSAQAAGYLPCGVQIPEPATAWLVLVGSSLLGAHPMQRRLRTTRLSGL